MWHVSHIWAGVQVSCGPSKLTKSSPLRPASSTNCTDGSLSVSQSAFSPRYMRCGILLGTMVGHSKEHHPYRVNRL